MKNKFSAFTLAEVLITLAVIGVVAAMVIPSISYNIMTKARAEQMKVAKQKFAKAIEQMALNYDLGPYYGTGENKTDATEKFVEKLGNYYKMAKVCSHTNLDDCWGYKEIKLVNGKTFDITKATTGKSFKGGTSSSDSDDYDSYTQGILGVDGTRFIVSFNKNCEPVEPQVFSWTSDATSHSAMGCITAIIDIDGDKAPNTVGKDISFINATSIGRNCIVEIGEGCFTAPFKPIPITYTVCDANRDLVGGTCFGDADLSIRSEPYATDSWAAAAIECGGYANMVTAEDFNEFAKTAYNTYYVSSGGSFYGRDGLKDGAAADFGLVTPTGSDYYGTIYIWLGETASSITTSDGRIMEASSTIMYNTDRFSSTASSTRNDHSNYAMCKM